MDVQYVVVTFVGILLAINSFLMKNIWDNHKEQHKSLDMSINALRESAEEITSHQITCSRNFASKEAMKRAHERIDDLEDRLLLIDGKTPRVKSNKKDID